MDIDDAYLKRYVNYLCTEIEKRQSPNLQHLFGYNGHPASSTDGGASTYLSEWTHQNQRFRQLQAKYLGVIKRLSMHIEMRDTLSAGHTMRLSRYAVIIGEELGWKRERVEEFEIGAYLHDIGKVCVTESVLNKAGGLTPRELRQVRRHVKIGANMLMKIDFLRPIVPYVLYHHERYDGRGYPFGLTGKDIPVEGRMLAVIDTFDALVNPRPYRKAFSYDRAIDELLKQKGHQLDPDVVDIFVEVLHNRMAMAS